MRESRAGRGRDAADVRTSTPCGTGGDGAEHLQHLDARARSWSPRGARWPSTATAGCRPKSGSADVLEALGVDIGFAGAGRPLHRRDRHRLHVRARASPAMKHAAPVRAELGVRTMFNCSAADEPGGRDAPTARRRRRVAAPDDGQVLARLGTQAAWVVHGHGGLDEVSLSGPTRVAALGGRCRSAASSSTPEDFGVGQAAPPAALRGGDTGRRTPRSRARLARN